MAMFGAVYYVAPRLFSGEVDWACSGTYKWIFRLTAIGAVVVLLAGLASYGHGHALQAGSPEVMKKALMPMRIAFLGEILFFLSSLIFLGSMACLLFRNCCGEYSPMALIRKCRGPKSKEVLNE